MKKSKKLIGIFSTLGALSIVGASCALGIVYSKNNNSITLQSDANSATISQTNNDQTASQASSSTNNPITGTTSTQLLMQLIVPHLQVIIHNH